MGTVQDLILRSLLWVVPSFGGPIARGRRSTRITLLAEVSHEDGFENGTICWSNDFDGLLCHGINHVGKSLHFLK